MNTKSISGDKHLPPEEKMYTLSTPKFSRNWRSVIHIIALEVSAGIMVGSFLSIKDHFEKILRGFSSIEKMIICL